MNSIVEINNLIFSYSRESGDETTGCIFQNAIDGVDLTIKKGSFTAIIGRNGSGKSTLAKNINALLLPSSGVVYVNGYDTRDQDHLWDIVEEDVAFGPENLGISPSEIRKRVEDSLGAVNMGDYRKKPPHLLSGGQKQRIAIAGVVAMKPQCIIFDEPTAMLDPKGRGEVMEIIRELNREGITVVLITHFMEEAALADRVIIMDEGKIKLDGSPSSVFAKRDELKSMSLDVPFIVELVHRLRQKGVDIPENTVSRKDLVEYICRSVHRK